MTPTGGCAWWRRGRRGARRGEEALLALDTPPRPVMPNALAPDQCLSALLVVAKVEVQRQGGVRRTLASAR